MIKIVGDPSADPTLRLEAMNTFAAVATSSHVDLLLDLIIDTTPGIRGAAMRALARVEPETFMSTLAGLDPDREFVGEVPDRLRLTLTEGQVREFVGGDARRQEAREVCDLLPLATQPRHRGAVR